ncbi:hypothetical protein MHYP_G00230680 [Metynnis hypsauchen]
MKPSPRCLWSWSFYNVVQDSRAARDVTDPSSPFHSPFPSRPPTRTGSRPSTSDSIRRTLDSDCWRSSQESLGPPDIHNTNGHSQSDLIPGLASRPKIPRSPGSDAGRPRLPPLGPKFSHSEPQQSSRPNSAAHSSQSSRK